MGSLGLVTRRGVWARWVAPAAFLLAVTGVVLLVRTGLRSDGKAAATTTASRVVRVTPKPRAVAPTRVHIPAQWYVIKSGDTLDAIAGRFATSVDALLSLNPGVEPTTLHPGERLRIK